MKFNSQSFPVVYRTEQFTIEFQPNLYARLANEKAGLTAFLAHLQTLIAQLETDPDRYNINPYPDGVKKGIHILGCKAGELQNSIAAPLVLKCSEGQLGTENLSVQFRHSLDLSRKLARRFTLAEQQQLQICPVYCYVQAHDRQARFKHILVMEWIQGVAIAEIPDGLNPEFCQQFRIPSVAAIARKRRFWLHRWLDRNPQRQLLKIQTAYLFRRLAARGIRIYSLNQKNILATTQPETGQVQYILIDTTADWSAPVSPLYNLVTYPFCG